MTKRLLIAYAHPDDESFGLGGLIGKYVAEGVEVSYLCATNGDVGTVSPELLNGYGSVAELRLAELDAAAKILKFKHLITMGYKDSGMMGSETTRDPASLWYAHERTPAEVTRRVVETIRELRPHVIITFNKYGGYGHPDHIAIQRATTEAFHKAGESSYVTGHEIWKPAKLYYSSVAKWMVRYRIMRARMAREDPRRVGRNKDIDMVRIIENAEPTHASIDVRDWFDLWDAASACHVSQGGGGFRQIPKRLRPIITPVQKFTRVFPAATPGLHERDLFDGVTGD